MPRYERLPTAPVPIDGSTPPATLVNRVDIDATVSFYGLYIAVNQQVVLQNQDTKRYGVFKPSLIDLEPEVAMS